MADATDYGKIIVLTGAGASAALGLHTMASFPGLLASAGQPLADLAQKMHWEKRRADVEWIYDRLEMYVEAGKAAGEGDLNLQHAMGGSLSVERFGNQGAEALAQLQGLMLEHWGRVDAADPGALSLYELTLVKLRQLNDAPLRVFTTNYDLTFEKFAERNMERVVNGVRPRGLDYVWDPATYAHVDDAAAFVVYRLHGCSHWFQDDSGEVRYQPSPDLARRGLRPMVVFPARSKSDQVYDDIFAFAYGEFRRALAQAGVCVVIGSSLRDRGVRDSIANADRATRFVVVDKGLQLEDVAAALGHNHGALVQEEFGIEDVNEHLLRLAEAGLRGHWIWGVHRRDEDSPEGWVTDAGVET